MCGQIAQWQAEGSPYSDDVILRASVGIFIPSMGTIHDLFSGLHQIDTKQNVNGRIVGKQNRGEKQLGEKEAFYNRKRWGRGNAQPILLPAVHPLKPSTLPYVCLVVL